MIATKMVKTICSVLVCAVLVLAGILATSVFMGGFADTPDDADQREGHFLPHQMKGHGKVDLSGVEDPEDIPPDLLGYEIPAGVTQQVGSNLITGPATVNENGTVTIKEGDEAAVNGNPVTGGATVYNDGMVIDKGGSAVVDGVEIDGPASVMKVPSGSANGPFGFADNDVSSSADVMKVTSEKSGMLYLKQQSFGTYNGQTWSEAKTYPAHYEGVSADYLRFYTAKFNSIETYTVTIEPLRLDGSIPRVTPYYPANVSGSSDVMQLSDTYAHGGTNEAYTMTCFEPNGETEDMLPEELIHYIEQYNEFVNDEYMYLDDETKTALEAIIRENNLAVVGDRDKIVKNIENYVKKAAYYNLKYNKALDNELNVVLSFLGDGYKDGICVHYASAATLLLRAAGIPARFTTGWAAEVEAGETATLSVGHAWVEYYVPGEGWYISDPTPERIELTLTPNTYRKVLGESDVIDASQLKWNGESGQGSVKVDAGKVGSDNRENYNEMLSDGIRFAYKVSGVQSSYGWGTTAITEVTVRDDDGQDITGRFVITTKTGRIQKCRYKLTFTSKGIDGNTVTYTGSPVDYNVVLTAVDGNQTNVMPAGYEYEITKTSSFMDVASSGKANFNVKITRGGSNVSSEFWLDSKAGNITVKPLAVEFTVKSKTVHLGEPIGEYEYSVTNGKLANGHEAQLVISTTLNEVGNKTIDVDSYKIVDSATGEDVTENYEVYFKNGQLTVLP